MFSQRIVVIEGQEVQLTDSLFRLMKYFEESEAIMPTRRHVIPTFTLQAWRNILQIIEAAHYKPITPPPVICDPDARNIIGSALSEVFEKMEYSQLNQVYNFAHYLKIEFVRKCVSAFLACRVFSQMNLSSYFQKKKALGIEQNLTVQKINEYMYRFPFIN